MTQFFFTFFIMFVGPAGAIDFVKVEGAQFMNHKTCHEILPMAKASMGEITYSGVKGTLVCLPFKLGEKRTSVFYAR
tara:strand:+ start:210 stop:440 length:231 start_codon:yes stop_codon:yes gene_type:complete